MRTNIKTHSGNRIVVEFDGKEVGLVQSVRMNDNYGLEDASGIGDIHVQEHVPTKAVHSISVSTMVLMKKNLRDVGIAPQNGDDVLAGLVFDICTYSKDTGELLRKYVSCSYDSGDVDVSAHRITMASAQFKALDVVGTLI
ncbi:hypothetical protein [Azospirillum sp.]|uniref:hypothetical protein n=1 Tax=Azospirillum sp. TaxID=34012 RepID=UPI003D75F332